MPPGGPKRVWVSGLSGGFPGGCSKMRLSLGEIAGIGPKPSNSDAKWNTAPPRRRNTAKPRRILDHYDTRTATHHITATAKAAIGPSRASGPSPYFVDPAHSSARPAAGERVLLRVLIDVRVGLRPPRARVLRTCKSGPASVSSAPPRARVLHGVDQRGHQGGVPPRGRTGSMREGLARHLREPAAPARVVPGPDGQRPPGGPSALTCAAGSAWRAGRAPGGPLSWRPSRPCR